MRGANDADGVDRGDTGGAEDDTTAGPGSRLHYDDVTKRFPDGTGVAEVSLTVEAGERVAVIGPSGAGKTTLLRLANGALRPDAGRVTVDGEPVGPDAVALAYGGGTLLDRRSALANVLAGRVGDLSTLRGLLEPLVPRDPAPALDLLDAVGLADKADVPAGELSAGERQRVAFARALVRDAPVVLADEPTANLDPTSRARVLDVLDAAAGDRTLVTVLHDVALARDRFERVVGLADGRIAFDETADAVTDERLSALFAGASGSGGGDSDGPSRATGSSTESNGPNGPNGSEAGAGTGPGEPYWYG